MIEVIEIFKALADETRLRILKLLLTVEESVCVCELVDALDLPQYLASRHLNILKRAGLLEGKRSGTWVYYSPVQNASPLIEGVFSLISDRLDIEGSKEDLKRLRDRMALRMEGVCVIGYESK
ncbi:MAG: ArsR/SmtB family transcription factor [Candidatus Bipolaricaulia bacterium]